MRLLAQLYPTDLLNSGWKTDLLLRFNAICSGTRYRQPETGIVCLRTRYWGLSTDHHLSKYRVMVTYVIVFYCERCYTLP
jgi:hypothetical protein